MRRHTEPKQSHPHKKTNSSQIILVPLQKYFCDVCCRELNFFTFISSNNLYYCIPCFARFRKWSYPYHVISKLEFTVFDDSWTAYEEVMLFYGLQKHGFGNWGDIADYIDTEKTREDVEVHYTKIYLQTPNFMPENHKIATGREITRNHKNSKKKAQRNRQSMISKRNNNSSIQKKNPKTQQVPVVGYMPLRQDFQFQYDNQAELLLAEMQFAQDDTQEQRQMKFKILDIYNDRLTQRNKKKEFVSSRGLLNYQKQLTNQKQRSKQDKQIYNMMKIFARFQTASDHQRLVQGIIKQKMLKQKIQMYKQLRNKGFTDKQKIQEQLLKKGQNSKNKKKNGNQYSYIINNYEQGRNHRRMNFDNNDISILKKNSAYFSIDQINLCKQLKLAGPSYMMIKQTILREYRKNLHLEREYILGIFNLDRFIVNKIIDFLVDSQGISCRG